MSIPVAASTAAPLAGPALRVSGSAVAPTDDPVTGGAALPVCIVSAAQVAAGQFVLAGNVTPLVMVAVNDGRPALGQAPQPVYVVDGSL